MTRKVQPGTWKNETVRKDTAHGKKDIHAPLPLQAQSRQRPLAHDGSSRFSLADEGSSGAFERKNGRSPILARVSQNDLHWLTHMETQELRALLDLIQTAKLKQLDIGVLLEEHNRHCTGPGGE